MTKADDAVNAYYVQCEGIGFVNPHFQTTTPPVVATAPAPTSASAPPSAHPAPSEEEEEEEEEAME